ncbi:hypothetical protein ZHAS_00007534 [Anopheles sinensis]|uniref:Uncharacterized protein n=1 Tax=Anopheles sinensis TaxID=74873 RepID=A0A084VQ28_ANOSI|nr:hypothetical protein ZHAS_00007534 [Anopheles sinensis]
MPLSSAPSGHVAEGAKEIKAVSKTAHVPTENVPSQELHICLSVFQKLFREAITVRSFVRLVEPYNGLDGKFSICHYDTKVIFKVQTYLASMNIIK